MEKNKTNRKRKGNWPGHKPQKKGRSMAAVRGSSAFMCTCDSLKEKKASMELKDLLTELLEEEKFANQQTNNLEEKSQSIESKKVDEFQSVSSLLQAEIEELNNWKSTDKIIPVEMNSRGVFMLQMTIPIDPVELLREVFRRVQTTGESFSRFIVRVVPLQYTCFADPKEILDYFTPKIAEVFTPSIPKKFAIHLKRRNNSTFPKDETIQQLAKKVGSEHKVDLENPDVIMVIEIFQSFCGLSIVDNASDFGNFNLREILAKKRNGNISNKSSDERKDNEKEDEEENGDNNDEIQEEKQEGNGEEERNA